MENTVKTLNGHGGVRAAAEVLSQVAPRPEERPVRAGKGRLIAAGSALALALAAGGFYAATRATVSTDDAAIEGHVVAVSPRVSGHIVRVLVDDNQTVKKGDLLAEIDPRDYQTKIDDAKASVQGAFATLRKSEYDVHRYTTLAKQNEASGQTVDHALADAQTARAALDAARARLKQAELDLSYTRIEAPQSGRVTHKTVEEGAFVGVGQALLAVVPSDIWVVANFKETQLRGMRPGQKALISVDAYPGKLKGHVDSVQAGTGARFSILPAENATGNFVKVVQRLPVKIVLDDAKDAQGLLAPGMSVEAEVEVQ